MSKDKNKRYFLRFSDYLNSFIAPFASASRLTRLNSRRANLYALLASIQFRLIVRWRCKRFKNPNFLTGAKRIKRY